MCGSVIRADRRGGNAVALTTASPFDLGRRGRRSGAWDIRGDGHRGPVNSCQADGAKLLAERHTGNRGRALLITDRRRQDRGDEEGGNRLDRRLRSRRPGALGNGRGL